MLFGLKYLVDDVNFKGCLFEFGDFGGVVIVYNVRFK